jgi:hypothetical protein
MKVKHPFGVRDPRDGSSEIRDTAATFDEAVRKWELLRAEEPEIHFDITGWNHGLLANYWEIRDLFASPIGTFECPICLGDTPHTHTPEEIAADREIQQQLQQFREKKRQEILRRVTSVMYLYAAPRDAVAGDFGFGEST